MPVCFMVCRQGQYRLLGTSPDIGEGEDFDVKTAVVPQPEGLQAVVLPLLGQLLAGTPFQLHMVGVHPPDAPFVGHLQHAAGQLQPAVVADPVFHVKQPDVGLYKQVIAGGNHLPGHEFPDIRDGCIHIGVVERHACPHAVHLQQLGRLGFQVSSPGPLPEILSAFDVAEHQLADFSAQGSPEFRFDNSHKF